jgi:hypothetical protein
VREGGRFSIECTQSIGRDLSNTARLGEPRAAARLRKGRCERRLACIRGVVYALIDNTWDGRYAFPFCATFKSDHDRDACLSEGVEYMKTLFEKSAADVLKDCKSYAVDLRRCAQLAAK